jgi:hypothetical protein
VFLRIAGFTIDLACEPGLNAALSAAAGRFVVDPAPADVRVTAGSGDLTNDGAGDLLFDSGGLWRMFRHERGWLFRFYSSAFGAAPYRVARWRDDFREGEILLARSFVDASEQVDPFEYPLDELLVIHLLARGHGIEIHGCGVADGGGKGYLFVGQSGAGKSTLARLWAPEPGAAVLSDDRIVVRRHQDGFWMYGTPWHGDEPLAAPRRARLSRILFLGHRPAHAIEPVEPATAAALLFAASFPPFHSRDALEFSLGFIDALVASVPAVSLAFRPDRSVIEIVRCAEPDRELRS